MFIMGKTLEFVGKMYVYMQIVFLAETTLNCYLFISGHRGFSIAAALTRLSAAP